MTRLDARAVAGLQTAVDDMRNHQHPPPGGGEDLYCMNLSSWLGERMGPVLDALREAYARIDGLEHELAVAKGEQPKSDMPDGSADAR